MTIQQRITIQHIEAAHEAERWEASQASRDVAQLDPRSVLLVVEAKLAEGRIEEAKAIVAQWKAGAL